MATGMQIMMKTMGIDPEKLLASVNEQVSEITQAVSKGEQNIAAIATSNLRIQVELEELHYKLDAILVALNIPLIPRATTLRLYGDAQTIGNGES